MNRLFAWTIHLRRHFRRKFFRPRGRDPLRLTISAPSPTARCAHQAGGGRLIVPAGVFMTAPFDLRSTLDVHLKEGAVIQAPDTFEALGLLDSSTLKSQSGYDPRR